MYLNQARTSQGTEDLLYHPYTIEYFIIKYFTGYKVFQYKAFHGSGRIHYHCALLILMIAVFMKRSHILHGMFPLTVNTTGILSFEDWKMRMLKFSRFQALLRSVASTKEIECPLLWSLLPEGSASSHIQIILWSVPLSSYDL